MNKKALEDEETLKYKIDKEPEIGPSYTITKILALIFALSIMGIIILYLMGFNSDNEEKTSYIENIVVVKTI